MGDIGKKKREIEYEPIEVPAVPATPAPAPVPEPARAPEKEPVPVGSLYEWTWLTEDGTVKLAPA